jgi:hypothetical protein
MDHGERPSSLDERDHLSELAMSTPENSHRTPERLSMRRGLSLPADLTAAVILDRIAGMEYTAIAVKHGIHHGTARRICWRAIKRGVITAEQVGYKPTTSRALEQSVYDAKWIARVKSKCVVNDAGCWVWQGFKSAKGYGLTAYRKKNPSVHRTMFQIVHGITLRTEQFVCHTCDVRACCNPDHLWLGDAHANNTDASVKGRHFEGKKTECERGHPFTPENVYMKNGSRACRACARGRQRVKAGWPEDVAYSLPPQPLGYVSNPNRSAA